MRYCDWYLTFNCPKPGPGRARDLARFLCLSDVLFFVGSLFEQVDGRTVHFSEKNRSKTGSHPACGAEMVRFSVLAPPIEFGRWHSPQVAPAAPPAPRVHSSSVGEHTKSLEHKEEQPTRKQEHRNWMNRWIRAVQGQSAKFKIS